MKLKLLAILILTSLVHAGTILVDLGNVTVGTNTSQALQQMGLARTLAYVFRHGQNPRKAYFAYLDTLVPHQEGLPMACDEEGNQLPQLMYDWLMSTRSCKEINDIIQNALSADNRLSYASKYLFSTMATMMFTPENFIKTKKLYPAMISLLEAYKNKGHTLIIGSNWDKESYHLFAQQYPDFIKLFDGAVISGEIHLIKPQAEFFKYAIAMHQMDPKQTAFIDDQPENIKAALECGITGIHCPKEKNGFGSQPNVAHVKAQLESWEQTIENKSLGTL